MVDRDLEDIVNELKSRLPHYRDDLYCRGVWDGAMMVLAYYDPRLFHKLFPDWVQAKKTLAEPKE